MGQQVAQLRGSYMMMMIIIIMIMMLLCKTWSDQTG
jgi:hypothetical protein